MSAGGKAAGLPGPLGKAAAAAAALVLAWAVLLGLGFRANLTRSAPTGLFRPAPGPPARGDLVAFCLEPGAPWTVLASERGYVGAGGCPSGLRPLLKRLAGLPGDLVEVLPEGLAVNGGLLPLSARPEADSAGRPMPPSSLRPGRIPEGMALVVSDGSAAGFDGRHFGLVPEASLAKYLPVLVF